ncbi:MAG: PAS domain-containing protein, partial [Balneolaceae bacterium]|nr:PAS domain-containing protein [Balneolaceae bacterium]
MDTARQIFEHSSDPMFMINMESRQIVDANDSAVDICGYSRKEFCKLNFSDLQPEKAAGKWQRVLDQTPDQPS